MSTASASLLVHWRIANLPIIFEFAMHTFAARVANGCCGATANAWSVPCTARRIFDERGDTLRLADASGTNVVHIDLRASA